MVDSILLQSTSSNCLEDGDHFLLTLNNLNAQREPSQAEQDIPEIQHGDPKPGSPSSQCPEGEPVSTGRDRYSVISGYTARKIGTKCAQNAQI